MGIGDWLMCSADAREMWEKKHVRSIFGNGKQHWWSEVFDNNPKITRPSRLEPGEKYAWIANYPGHRPYCLGREGWKFIYNKAFKVRPGEIFLTDEEKEFGEMHKGCIVVEPNVKTVYSGPYQLDIGRNKAWDWERWLEVLKLPLPWVQLGQPGVKEIGVKRVVTKNFREAMAVLANARLLVTTDGALQHAAGALGIPTVALFGGFASPEMMGYDFHTNIWNGAEACGTVRGICPHCRAAMDSISVEQVAAAIEKELALEAV